MNTIGIGEIQKNSSIFSNLTQAIQIVDKRKKQPLAMVYPIKNHSIVESLAGKYKNIVTKVNSDNLTIEQVKEQAMLIAMEEKYGLPS